jgi:hypothetical protein
MEEEGLRLVAAKTLLDGSREGTSHVPVRMP